MQIQFNTDKNIKGSEELIASVNFFIIRRTKQIQSANDPAGGSSLR
jgi:hypothetical protein